MNRYEIKLTSLVLVVLFGLVQSSKLAMCTFHLQNEGGNLPKSRVTKLFASNASKLLICSPVPMKMIGLLVAATLHVTKPSFITFTSHSCQNELNRQH